MKNILKLKKMFPPVTSIEALDAQLEVILNEKKFIERFEKEIEK